MQHFQPLTASNSGSHFITILLSPFQGIKVFLEGIAIILAAGLSRPAATPNNHFCRLPIIPSPINAWQTA
jgi:hypothetical protein